MTRTTAYYLGASAALLALFALVRPTPPLPPAEDTGQADVNPTDTNLDVRWLRMAARHRLVAEVIDGRRSVLAAAALFRTLDQIAPALEPPRPDRGAPLPVPFPAATEDEWYCLLVARWVYLAIADESLVRADEVADRLAAEVWAEAAARGAVRLPDPATLESVDQLLTEARTVEPRNR